jgi:hypothetical protein
MTVLRCDITPAEPTASARSSPQTAACEAGRRSQERSSLWVTMRMLWRRHSSRMELARMNRHMLAAERVRRGHSLRHAPARLHARQGLRGTAGGRPAELISPRPTIEGNAP